MDSIASDISRAAKVRTLICVASLAIVLVLAVGCARPVDERTAREKKVLKQHRQVINSAKEEKNDPYWQAANAEIMKSPEQLLAQDTAERQRGELLPKLIRGPHNIKSLLLTFDDGPHPLSTLALLKILKSEGVPATFFVIGKMAEKHPDLIRAIARDGHTLANHSFSHVTLPNFSLEEQRTEYRANNELIEKITGRKMTFCRPPGGDYDIDTIRAAESEGLTTVLWTDDPGDFANPGAAIVLDRTLKKLSNGGVILLHDGSINTLETLVQLIHEAKERGFTFTTPQVMADELQIGKRTSFATR